MRRAAIIVIMSIVFGALGWADIARPNLTNNSVRDSPSATMSSSATPRPWWKRKLDRVLRGRPMSVAVSHDGRKLYARDAHMNRVPASNQKLLASMAFLDRFSPSTRFPTIAAATRVNNGVIDGALWILGRGDPAVGGLGYGQGLPFKPTLLSSLARKIDHAGVRRIRGRVVGATTYFARDWDAPGWKSDFASRYIPLPTALTFNGNVWSGRHIDDPERRAAQALTKRLRARGIKIGRRPAVGKPPRGLRVIARVQSTPLRRLVAHMNTTSSNFFAEVLGKRLAVATSGSPGTIAAGAAATAAWAENHGVEIRAFDSSGLSYQNRATAGGVVRLLTIAEGEQWGAVLRASLPHAGQGTLEDRLAGVKVRAKTGTLESISALSGYVWLRRAGTWAEFSILSRGLSKSTAVEIEDKVLRVLARSAR